MLALRGAPALSVFRLQRLEARLAEVAGRPVRLAAEFVHFVDVEQALDGAARQVLDRLLQYGPAAHPNEPTGTLLLTVPRPGTISPWSSKATDIARNCGLDPRRRSRERRGS